MPTSIAAAGRAIRDRGIILRWREPQRMTSTIDDRDQNNLKKIWFAMMCDRLAGQIVGQIYDEARGSLERSLAALKLI